MLDCFVKKNLVPTLPTIQLNPLCDITWGNLSDYVEPSLQLQNASYYFIYIYSSTPLYL